jgi:hypothetical protein
MYYKVYPLVLRPALFSLLNKSVEAIYIERRKNRLLKFCYVPATSAAHTSLHFFFFSFFFASAVYSTNEAKKAGLKQMPMVEAQYLSHLVIPQCYML